MKKKLIVFFAVFQLLTLSVFAQGELKINGIFDKYGKKEGSILVQLSTDILSQGSRITSYKSLIMDDDVQINKETLAALNTDILAETKISEVKKGGQIESGTYCLHTRRKGNLNEYILFKVKSKKITIVYLKGDFSPNQLDQELKKLKDLFIYVNNKRIKLQ